MSSCLYFCIILISLPFLISLCSLFIGQWFSIQFLSFFGNMCQTSPHACHPLCISGPAFINFWMRRFLCKVHSWQKEFCSWELCPTEDGGGCWIRRNLSTSNHVVMKVELKQAECQSTRLKCKYFFLQGVYLGMIFGEHWASLALCLLFCFLSLRAVIGELDDDTDGGLDFENIRAEPLNAIVH